MATAGPLRTRLVKPPAAPPAASTWTDAEKRHVTEAFLSFLGNMAAKHKKDPRAVHILIEELLLGTPAQRRADLEDDS